MKKSVKLTPIKGHEGFDYNVLMIAISNKIREHNGYIHYIDFPISSLENAKNFKCTTLANILLKRGYRVYNVKEIHGNIVIEFIISLKTFVGLFENTISKMLNGNASGNDTTFTIKIPSYLVSEVSDNKEFLMECKHKEYIRDLIVDSSAHEIRFKLDISYDIDCRAFIDHTKWKIEEAISCNSDRVLIKHDNKFLSELFDLLIKDYKDKIRSFTYMEYSIEIIFN